MRERPSDRWVSITLSVLLHAAVVGVLAYGWWTYKHRPKPAPPALAIEATVVDSSTLPAKPPEPEPQPEPEPEPPPAEPPEPTPEEIARQEQEAEQRRIYDEKLAEQRAQEAEQQRVEVEKRAAEERRFAEVKRKEEAKRAADAKRKAEEARQQAQREAELRRQLEAEDRVRSAQASGLQASWVALIRARIERAWIRPPSARPGLDCTVFVTQVPGGEVVNVRVGACNGDRAVRDSIEAAVYRASPLPPPPDPALFERNLELTFRPTE